MTTKMSPSSNATPFAGGVLLSQPIIDKIDRGIKTLAVNYGLNGKLRWQMLNEPNGQGQAGWTFQLFHLDQLAKPLVSITNRSISGLNKFLMECGRVIAKQYGQTEKQRKTA